MKKYAFVLALALLAAAGCHNSQKKVYTGSDLKEQPGPVDNKEVDYLGLYYRAHELDSLRNVAEKGAEQCGVPFEALPDSVTRMWNDMIGYMVARNGDTAFGIYESHRSDFDRYLRLDFISYGFLTKVYLPYKATRSTKEEYGKICVEELENAYVKALKTKMQTGRAPSHYPNLLKDLFYAFVNNGMDQEALDFCNKEVLGDIYAREGESLNYANMLTNRAHLYNRLGQKYSASVSAKQAIAVFEKISGDALCSEADRCAAAKAKASLEENLKNWLK